jgi:predicted aspartyl protease
LITGWVTEGGIPTIELKIAGSQYPGIIDTGFNGDVELPEELQAFVNARFICRAKAQLAGGITIADELYLVDFPFDGDTIRAHATFAPSRDILIGTGLLRSYRLTINFVAGTVRLQRLG